MQRDETAPGQSVNPEALAAVLSALGQIEEAAAARGLPLAPMRATDIAALRGVLDASDSDDGAAGKALLEAILAAFGPALAEFEADRLREGAALLSVVEGQIAEIERLTAAAAEAAGDRAASAREALDRNLARLLDATEVPDAARLTQELALIAVKTDVTEEIDRLGAHVAAARGLLATGEPVGRKLDFLMQEFNREANTLCSKAQSAALTALGLDLKAVIDQMREQVQNIE